MTVGALFYTKAVEISVSTIWHKIHEKTLGSCQGFSQGILVIDLGYLNWVVGPQRMMVVDGKTELGCGSTYIIVMMEMKFLVACGSGVLN